MNWEILKPYKKLIISFLIIMTTIIILGYAFIFDYYKDVHKSNYIVVTCLDPETLEEYEERYNNIKEFEDSLTVCGEIKIDNPLFPKIKINSSFH